VIRADTGPTRPHPFPHSASPSRSRFASPDAIRGVSTFSVSPLMPRFKLTTIAVFVALAAGCANHRPVQPASDATAVATLQDGLAAEASIPTGFDARSVFVAKTLAPVGSQQLPAIQVPNMSISDAGAFDALTLLARSAHLTLRIKGGPGALDRAASGVIFDVSGALPDVLEEITNQYGLFWRVQGKTLIVEPDRRFIVELPPLETDTDTLAGLTNTLQRHGAKDVFLDHAARTLTFRSDRESLAEIEAYLQYYRSTRSMHTYDIEIWQVNLSDTNSKGIDWSQLSYSAGASAISVVNGASSAAAGIGLTLQKGRFSVGSVVRFLETQGTVKTLSHPRITLMSGSKGRLSVGESTDYVSKVGTNTGTALSQTTVETKTLSTGLQMQISGDYSDNTVYTQLHLKLADLLRFNSFTALGTELKLPQTQSRELQTSSRARPGDTILLGGMMMTTDNRDASSGFTGLSSTATRTKSELVIAITPRIVHFNGAAVDTPPAAPASQKTPQNLENTHVQPTENRPAAADVFDRLQRSAG